MGGDKQQFWAEDLPADLQNRVKAHIKKNPNSEAILSELAAYYQSKSTDKRRKTNQGKANTNEAKHETTAKAKLELNSVLADSASNGQPKAESRHVLKITTPVKKNEVIFEMPSLSFLSPIRRKLNLVFHLHIIENEKPSPVLSVVNPTSNVPEISVANLHSAIKLCLIFPILGNSTVSTKKDTVMMSIWLHDNSAVTVGKNDPIICTLNLDSVKKQLMTDGKIPAQAEAQLSSADSASDAIKPINELIIDFLQRQFNLCGVKLINFLPSAKIGKNGLNMNDDNIICLSHTCGAHNDLVMAGAYKGSKEGALLLASVSPEKAFLIFGFKKPVLMMDFTSLKAVSYSNITRFTFSMLVTCVNSEGEEESHDFAMIDQKGFQAIDDFVKKMNIEDNSFDEKHREKRKEVHLEDDKAEDTLNSLAVDMHGSDDEEDDETYTGGVEEEEEGSGSEIDEDFDSDNESGSESDGGDSENSGPSDKEDGVELSASGVDDLS